MTRAVGLMATHANPIQTTNSSAFTIDAFGEAFGFAWSPGARSGLAAAHTETRGLLLRYFPYPIGHEPGASGTPPHTTPVLVVSGPSPGFFCPEATGGTFGPGGTGRARGG